jgi:hypothetical protein
VLVRVRLPGGVDCGVLVLVVHVVHMAVLVLQGVVHVEVVVPFTEQQRNAEPHESCRSYLPETDRLTNERDGCDSSYKGRRCEEGRLTGRPKKTHGIDRKHQAEPVTPKAHEQPSADESISGEPLTKAKGEGEARTACEQPFRSRDCKRISQREPLGEVVVYRPAQARPADGGHAEPVGSNRAALVAEHHEPEKDQPAGPGLAATEVLSEEDHSKYDRERSLKVEEKRRTDGRQSLKTPKQQDRTYNAASESDSQQKTDVVSPKRCLLIRGVASNASQADNSQPEASSQVEQAAQGKWLCAPQEKFRERRTDPKENRRGECR